MRITAATRRPLGKKLGRVSGGRVLLLHPVAEGPSASPSGHARQPSDSVLYQSTRISATGSGAPPSGGAGVDESPRDRRWLSSCCVTNPSPAQRVLRLQAALSALIAVSRKRTSTARTDGRASSTSRRS